MSSIDDEDHKLQDQIDAFETAVAKVRTAQTFAEKKKEEKVARSLFNNAKSHCQTFRTSTNKLEDPIQRSTYNRKYSTYDKKLTEYDKELRMLLTAPKKVEHPPPKKETNPVDQLNLDIEMASPQQILHKANEVQDDILISLQRSKRIAYTVRDQEHVTLQILSQQTEKINKIDVELVELDNQLDRAKSEVQWFFRQMAKDRCCIVIMILLLVGVCGLIGWKIYSKRFPNAPFALPTTITTTLPPGVTTTPASPGWCIFDCE